MVSAITMTPPLGLETMTEAQWQRLVVEAAGLLGWYVEHFPQMVGNPSGWPDLVLFRNERYLLIELKDAKGKPRPSQRRWTERVAPFGVQHHLLRPTEDDWDTLMRLLA